MVFEKCEMATKSIDSMASNSFTSDAKSLIQQQLKEKNEITTDNHEVNDLVSFLTFHK